MAMNADLANRANAGADNVLHAAEADPVADQYDIDLPNLDAVENAVGRRKDDERVFAEGVRDVLQETGDLLKKALDRSERRLNVANKYSIRIDKEGEGPKQRDAFAANPIKHAYLR